MDPRRLLAIRDVTDWHVLDEETRGTKDKCWLLEPQRIDEGPSRWLFKRRRNPAIGDDWSECIAAQIAEFLGIRHAEYQLAARGSDHGVISRDFTDMGKEGDFTPGRDLLAERFPGYPKTERPYRLPEHTVKKALEVIGAPAIVEPPAVELFIGYLMLDAIIGNTDRHHENWGVLKRPNAATILAPTFDHASSLGFNLTDEERNGRLTSRDKGYQVGAFARKARSGLYTSSADKQPLHPLAAFQEAAAIHPGVAKAWQAEAALMDTGILEDCVARVPAEVMTTPARRFALALLEVNLENLRQAKIA